MTASTNLNIASRASTQSADNCSKTQHLITAGDNSSGVAFKSGEKSLMEITAPTSTLPQQDACKSSINERGLPNEAEHHGSTLLSTSASLPRGDEPEDGITAAGPGSDPNQKQGTKGKGGQISERDSMIALLSLGRDLQGSEEGEGQSTSGKDELAAVSTTHAALKRPPPQPILPMALASKPSKKRQKKGYVAPHSTPLPNENNSQAGYKYPPDFWYWLHPGESAGEWDVLVSSYHHHIVYYLLFDSLSSSYLFLY